MNPVSIGFLGLSFVLRYDASMAFAAVITLGYQAGRGKRGAACRP